MHGEHENVRRGRFLADRSNDFEAVHFRHGQIEHEQVGLVLPDVLKCLHAVGGFGTNFDVRQRLQHGADAGAHDYMVVGNENTVRFGEVHNGPRPRHQKRRLEPVPV
jgi:hypothetical protein